MDQVSRIRDTIKCWGTGGVKTRDCNANVWALRIADAEVVQGTMLFPFGPGEQGDLAPGASEPRRVGGEGAGAKRVGSDSLRQDRMRGPRLGDRGQARPAAKSCAFEVPRPARVAGMDSQSPILFEPKIEYLSPKAFSSFLFPPVSFFPLVSLWLQTKRGAQIKKSSRIKSVWLVRSQPSPPLKLCFKTTW